MMAKGGSIGYREYFARLDVLGNIQDFRAISHALGVEPTRVHTKQERPTRISPPYGYDAWIFRAPVPRNRALKYHAQWLHRRFAKKSHYLKQLTKTHKVYLYCSYHSDYDQGRLEFPPEVLKWCGELGIPIHVSILVQE
jgi:hypothetical protein